MINSENEVLTETTNINTWKSELKKLRYPQTTLSDQELKTKLEALPWPYGAKVKFERRGDRAGVEVKLFISSSADLTKSISALANLMLPNFDKIFIDAVSKILRSLIVFVVCIQKKLFLMSNQSPFQNKKASCRLMNLISLSAHYF